MGEMMYIDVDVPGGPEEEGAPHWGYAVTAPQRGNRFQLWCAVHLQRPHQDAPEPADGRVSPHGESGRQDGEQERVSGNDLEPITRPGGVCPRTERRRAPTGGG